MDLNRLILGKSYNSTKVFRTAQHVVQAILLGIVVPLLILLLIWDLTDNPNPVPAVVVIAGLVMLCFFFSYVFVVPDDLTSSATDRTLAIASKIFAYTSRGLTPEAALGASKIILSETIASAICFTDGKQVLASWGEDSAKCPAGTPVVLRTTLNVINSGEQSVFSRDASTETGGYFPRLRAGIVAPLTVRGHCVGTLELYYPRLSSIDMRQTALASGFAEILSTQLAIHELEVQKELTARAEVRALQAQINPHFLFNTLNNIYSLIAINQDKAQYAVHDLSKMLRHVLYENNQHFVPINKEFEFMKSYIELMSLRLPKNTRLEISIPEQANNSMIAPLLFIPLLENAFKHGVSSTQESFINIKFDLQNGNRIDCRVENSNYPKKDNDRSGSGIGLINLQRRLELLYSGKYIFNREIQDDKFVTQLIIQL